MKAKAIFETVKQILLKFKQPLPKTKPFKKASLFPDGRTNVAALSQVLRGVAEVLSQKSDLRWNKCEETLSYEQEVCGGKGKICYYVTDNSDDRTETLAEEAACRVIDQFDPRAAAIHLIYCALAANLNKPWEDEFVIDDRLLLEYTGLVKRRDLCRHKQLTILDDLLRQPAQVLADIAWFKQGKVEAFTITDLKIWNITILREFDTDKVGNPKLTGLRVIGKPGEWAKYFLNKYGYYHHTGIITKKTVQKLFSIGKQNAGAARILVWLTFHLKPECFVGKTVMKIAYGSDKIASAEHDRQLRRQLADDFETDLKVVKEVGWVIELEEGPAWLTSNTHTKRPVGFWNQLLNAKWRVNLPDEAHVCLTLPNCNRKYHQQPPPGDVIREARKAKGWSRAFFAATMGKSISWVDAVETGHRNVAQKDLPKLLKKLELNQAVSS